MKLYIIYIELGDFSTKISVSTAEVISHCLLNKSDVYEVDGHYRLSSELNSSILTSGMLGKWLTIGNGEKAYYTDSKEEFESTYENCLKDIRKGIEITNKSLGNQ